MSQGSNLLELTFGKAMLGVFGYIAVMFLYTTLNIVLWRNIHHPISAWLNLITMIIMSFLYIWFLAKTNGIQLNAFTHMKFQQLCIAITCSLLFYLLLDCFLDPLLERIFPQSGAEYQQSLMTLSKTPVASFLHVCILAPIIEEMLIRGYVLDGLHQTMGAAFALFLSTLIFALLHFNMAQTLSAFVCGFILGILYLHTGSLMACIVAHIGYNTISYIMTILPLFLNK